MRNQRFLPWLTLISIAGIALGIMALVTVLSVMQGFNQELEKKLMGFNSHLTLLPQASSAKLTTEQIEEILKDKFVSVSPFVQGEAIAKAESLGDVWATGVRVRGITPKQLGGLKGVDFYFPIDALQELEAIPPRIILGQEILTQLVVHPDFADEIILIAPLAEVGPTGELEPIMRKFQLLGSFRSGMYDYDSKVVFVSTDQAKKLLGQQASTGWQINLKQSGFSNQAAKILREKLGASWKVETWQEQNKKLFAALKLERWAMSTVLVLIVLIASFSIVGVIMMKVSGKQKDVAILQTLGLPKSKVKNIFLLYGVRIGVIGSLIGAVLGSGICALLSKYPVVLPQSYYLDKLPVQWSLTWTLLFIALGVLLATISGLYPVSQACKQEPVVTLRYE
ncbi:MAG: ABC transporter permease [Pseudomonadota bacterium]